MSQLYGPWKALGIAPTGDLREIRRAYAVKLKAIDVNRDPQAFIALREAFDRAQVEARWIDQRPVGEAPETPPDAEVEAADDEYGEDEDDDDWDDWLEGETLADGDSHALDPLKMEIALAPAARSPWAPDTAEDYDDHARALSMLLLGEHAEPWPSDFQIEEMKSLWEKIIRDPRMHEMSFYGDAELWFADLIARAVPFSDALVAPVSDYFGWMHSAGEISQGPAIAYVVRRRQTLAFFDEIRSKGHRLRPAYLELTRPAHEKSRRGAVNGKRVRELLTTVRTRYPELEGTFDTLRVAMWEPGSGKSGWRWTGIIIFWIIIAAIRFAASHLPETNSNSSFDLFPASEETIALTNDRVDTDRALEGAFAGDLDIATIEDKNPELYAQLLKRWQSAAVRKEGFTQYAEELRKYLNSRYESGLRGAPLPLLRESFRLAAARNRALLSDTATCGAYLRGEDYDADKLPSELRKQQRALIAKVVLATHGDAPLSSEKRSFNVPHTLVVKAAARAGMTPEEMGKAMQYKGTDAQQCAGRLAFTEMVLAEPDAVVGKLLREM